MVLVAQGWSVPPGWWWVPQVFPAWTLELTILLMLPSGQLQPQRLEQGEQTYQWTLLALRYQSRPPRVRVQQSLPRLLEPLGLQLRQPSRQR